jgi:hypothetical protein
MTMLSGLVIIVSRAAAQATAVIVIGPAAAVIDTNFFVTNQPLPGWLDWYSRRRNSEIHMWVYGPNRPPLILPGIDEINVGI